MLNYESLDYVEILINFNHDLEPYTETNKNLGNTYSFYKKYIIMLQKKNLKIFFLIFTLLINKIENIIMILYDRLSFISKNKINHYF
jgi:hypothetical protein